MGTNYYLHLNCCPHCGRSENELHIGKSSAGWCFGLHVERDDDDVPKDLNGWKALFEKPGSIIKDEYGSGLSAQEMMGVITDRAWKERDLSKPPTPSLFMKSKTWDDFLESNQAEWGPNNLLRSKIDSRRSNGCIGHGEGTWDLITGDFS